MLTKIFFSERSLQSDQKMYLYRSDISNIREVTIGDILRRSGRYGAELLTRKIPDYIWKSRVSRPLPDRDLGGGHEYIASLTRVYLT